jgi:hypothetical protein
MWVLAGRFVGQNIVLVMIEEDHGQNQKTFIHLYLGALKILLFY